MTSPHEAIRAALKPFAEAAEGLDPSDEDGWLMWEHPQANCVSVGDFRRAAEAYAALEQPMLSGGDGMVMVPRKVVAYLRGEGPLEGKHFCDPGPFGPARPYWWRHYLPETVPPKSAPLNEWPEGDLARKLYLTETNNHPQIHCNRFPSWDELTSEEKQMWTDRAAAAPASNGEAVVERMARADGLSQALEILEEYEGVQGAKIKIVAAINAIRENQS